MAVKVYGTDVCKYYVGKIGDTDTFELCLFLIGFRVLQPIIENLLNIND